MSMIKNFIVIVMCFVMVGCSHVPSSNSTNSVALSNILRPVKDSLIQSDKKPLIFPTTITVLMVPSNSYMLPLSSLRVAAEDLKKRLLKSEKYINGVSIVSAEDIDKKITLDEIRDIYGSDIIVLISHQQDQTYHQNSFFSLLDIAIAPAFIVPSVGVKTTTVIDGKIIHIPSNAIVFRLSAIDERSKFVTKITSYNGDKEEFIDGFSAAILKFGDNISNKLNDLDKFNVKDSVSFNKLLESKISGDKSENNQLSQTNERDGNNWSKVDGFKSSGGGSMGYIFLLVILLIGFIRSRS